MQRLLIICAMASESEPLRQAASTLEMIPFPLGELFRLELPKLKPELYLAHFGMAKTNTAAGLSLAIERLKPDAVVQMGIGGAFVGSFLSIGMVALAKEDIHLDTGVRGKNYWQSLEDIGWPVLTRDKVYFNHYPCDPKLTQKIADATGLPIVTFGTSEAVTGDFEEAAIFQKRFDLSIESMEGASAAQVCLAQAVAFAEMRSVSNIVGERDKKAWNIPLAVRNVNDALIAFLEILMFRH